MKPIHSLARLAALLLAACAYPADVAFAEEDMGEEPGVIDETPIEDVAGDPDGVVGEGEVMPEDWIYMTTDAGSADGDEAGGDGAVVLELEDGTVVSVDSMEEEGEVDITAEPLMYTTSTAESAVTVNAPDFVDASGISDVQIDPAFDGNSVVDTEFEPAPGESLAAPELPSTEGGGARIQDGRLVSSEAAPPSK